MTNISQLWIHAILYMFSREKVLLELGFGIYLSFVVQFHQSLLDLTTCLTHRTTLDVQETGLIHRIRTYSTSSTLNLTDKEATK